MTKVFETERLIIRKINEKDLDFLYKLWTNTKVMVNVGFPKGLRINKKEIMNKYINKKSDSEFNQVLIAMKKETKEPIGECKLGLPDKEDISETDIKLLPEFWGHKYGVEIKKGLVNYIFKNTKAKGIKATPNMHNIASQKMQEEIGAKKIGDTQTFYFPEKMQDYTTPVTCYTYIIFKKDWEERNN